MMPERRQEPEYEGEHDFLQKAAAEDDLQDQVSLETLLAQEESKEKNKDGSSLRTQLDAQLQQLFQLESTSEQRIYVEQLMESGIMLDALEGPARTIEARRFASIMSLVLLAVMDIVVFSNFFDFPQDTYTALGSLFGLCTLFNTLVMLESAWSETYSAPRASEKVRMLIICKELDIDITKAELSVLAELLAHENKRRKILKKYPIYSYDPHPKLLGISKLDGGDDEKWNYIHHPID